MSKVEIMNKATRAINKVGFVLKKHSPEILVGVGVVGTVASTVMACKATTKLNDIVEKRSAEINAIKDYKDCEWVNVKKEDGTIENEYTENDMKKDLTVTYTQTALDLIKLYGPSVVLGTASIVSILAGHNITRKRNVAISAAYMAVDKGFKEYRGRVVERFGKDLDRELKYNIKSKEIEETIVDEKGKEKTVKKNVDVIDATITEFGPTVYSPYARFFDDGCTGWDKDPSVSLMILEQQQTYANDKLKAQGYLFLNEVYEMLGIPKCAMGQCVGWIYDEKNPSGDNYVDFGIWEGRIEKNRDFVNGYENVILLDFNVDGNILELM